MKNHLSKNATTGGWVKVFLADFYANFLPEIEIIFIDDLNRDDNWLVFILRFIDVDGGFDVINLFFVWRNQEMARVVFGLFIFLEAFFADHTKGINVDIAGDDETSIEVDEVDSSFGKFVLDIIENVWVDDFDEEV